MGPLFDYNCFSTLLCQLNLATIFFSDHSEAAEEEDDGLKMELLGSSGRGGRRSFSERKLISDLGGHGTPQKELLHFESSQFDQGRLTTCVILLLKNA